MTEPNHAGGRPTAFSQDMADAICGELAEGLSLHAICTRDDMPSARTVHEWLENNPEFAQQYARAISEGQPPG